MRRISLACIAMSDAWPDAPPDGSTRIKLISDNHKMDMLRTMNHDTCIWKTMPFPPLSGSEKERSHRCSHSKAVSMNRRRYILCRFEHTARYRKVRTHLHLEMRQRYKFYQSITIPCHIWRVPQSRCHPVNWYIGELVLTNLRLLKTRVGRPLVSSLSLGSNHNYK